MSDADRYYVILLTEPVLRGSIRLCSSESDHHLWLHCYCSILNICRSFLTSIVSGHRLESSATIRHQVCSLRTIRSFFVSFLQNFPRATARSASFRRASHREYTQRPLHLGASTTPSDISNMPFPSELFLMIFSQVHTGAHNEVSPKTTLKNLTLTCKEFYCLAQPLLFESCTVTICRDSPDVVRNPYAPSWQIYPLKIREPKKTIEKLSFMGQERIAAGIHSCLVTPTEYLKHGRDRYNHCLDDPRERVILDFFFDDLLPKLVNLKHLELARITLTSFHLRCLRNVPIIHSLHVETCFSKEDEHGDEESLHDRLDALPVKHLVFQQMPIDWTSPNVYVPLPQPALLESLSFYMFQPARQDLFEDPYHNLLPWLTSLGPFPSLRSLNVVWVPCGAQCDWRPFISSHCPSLERLSIVQSVGAKLDATPQQFPSLKFFRGTWNDARLYGFGPGCSGLQHLLVSAKCAQIPIRAREDRTLTDSTALSGPVVLAGLNESPGGFAHLESLKISMYDVSDELITRLFRCCPRLRALKIDSRVLYRFRENGLSALASVLIAAVSLPDLEYMSLCFVNVATEERPQLDRMIYFLSSQLRVHCPKLRYVHIAPVPGRISEEGYCTVRFDPVGARWLIQDYSIESWWNGIVIGHTLSLRRLESFNTRITEARAAVMPLFLRFLVS